MKRSDAVKILRDIFLTHMNCAYSCCSTDEEMYSKVLSEIQNRIEMLPPPVQFGGECWAPIKNEWEPEND